MEQTTKPLSLGRKNWLFARLDADGRPETDNNAVEQTTKPLSLGRKNWLFARLDADGTRAAAIASLVGTAKLNRIDLEAYTGASMI